MSVRKHLLAFGVAAAVAGAGIAQEARPAAPADEWEHGVAVYMWGAGLSGTATVKGVYEAEVDASISEILEDLEMAGFVAYRGKSGPWAIMANAIFVGLGATEDLPAGGAADVDVDLSLLEADGAYAVSDWCEIVFGVRGVQLDLAVEARTLLGTSGADDGKSWIDPLFGARFEVPMGKTWAFVGRGDVGGFGVGSDFAWQATVHFDWRFSEHVGVAFGYEVLYMDYDDGEGIDRFVYDATMQGPVAAVTFAF